MKRILLISPNAPYPPNSGAAQRTFLLFESLSLCGPVDLVVLNDETYPVEVIETLRTRFNLIAQVPRTAVSQRDFEPVFRLPFVGTPVRWVWRLWQGARATLKVQPHVVSALTEVVAGGHYRAIVSRYLWPACQADAFAHAPVFVDLDDLESEVYKSQASAARVQRKRSAVLLDRLSLSYQRQEAREVARCAGGWVAKAKDLVSLGAAPLAVLPNIPFSSFPSGTSPLPPPPSARPVVLGVGVFDWMPNRTGFDWFASHVWPKVLAAQPNAELHLVGHSSDAELVARWHRLPGVRYLGRVADLVDAYAAASITVAPLFVGGGTNIKVIESLAFGRCCVGTPHAFKGFEGLSGLFSAVNPDDFAAHCCQLLSTPTSTHEIGRSASVVANRRFSFENFSSAVRGVVGDGAKGQE